MSRFESVEIPYGAYWSTPFAKWQGALQHLHSGMFAAHVAKAELARRNLKPDLFDAGVFGQTVTQFQSFMAAPWPLAQAGLSHVAGPLITQVCATGPRILLSAAAEIQMEMATVSLALSGDRTSNGPHIYYPAPSGPGGTGRSEDQVLYNFSHDPIGNHSMAQTAENVAAKQGITAQEQHDVVLMRTEQYKAALADDRAFQKRYMTLPFDVPDASFRKNVAVMEGDEGVTFSTAEGLTKLKPVISGGTVTFGSQTHPADGNAAIVLAHSDKARELSADPSIRVSLLGFGQGRVDLGYMPEAPVCASEQALRMAGLSIADIDAVKSHNPFAVNDIAFSRATGFPIEKMNNFGCSLIWGHPQGPTGVRAIIELIEELAIRGGGRGLFQGCAAGDSSMAVVIEVGDR
ncbi:thiolase family protein [Aquisediminimonas profunda]|uniref:thiolase family protein n=1 Tax=Aquisediminimonas profunda TaxID=1550733 RepID=UPI001C633882|nr:thiolase family protein [Aquisediminimonas profunda]